ncbi:hypothetical protein SRB5_57350 [Streptomyces sp. RB5]|uniref:Uncharacterized protein n=1 Tax=Streptomyces smaragdinus TaxID=2585196 RepID=A0A7K0CRD1_9ACTN|nr:hypothetical protein [Streptomyces smaragdinus]MQY15552.1 hypothetical protein [Streptomyces smaragdinus]
MTYCDTSGAPSAPAGTGTSPDEPRADCVQCGEATEYAESVPGVVLCPACEWLEAQRTACSG